MMIKRLLLPVIFFGLIQATSPTVLSPQVASPQVVSPQVGLLKIVKALNESAQVVQLAGEGCVAVVKSFESKKMLLQIPFNELNNNLVDFIQDRPYVPPRYIELTTSQGTFYVWRDHRGVILAKAFKLGMSRSDARPHILLTLNPEELSSSINCMLFIGFDGSFSLNKI